MLGAGAPAEQFWLVQPWPFDASHARLDLEKKKTRPQLLLPRLDPLARAAPRRASYPSPPIHTLAARPRRRFQPSPAVLIVAATHETTTYAVAACSGDACSSPQLYLHHRGSPLMLIAARNCVDDGYQAINCDCSSGGNARRLKLFAHTIEAFSTTDATFLIMQCMVVAFSLMVVAFFIYGRSFSINGCSFFLCSSLG